ncbi:MAG: LPS export ABC transporter periplasmic protein LptC [Bacteroidia bacterium]
MPFIFPKLRILLLLAVLTVLLSACGEDDLKNASAISSKKVALTKDRSYGVEVIYSDSAVVKAKGYAPIYDKVTPVQGTNYNEMPEGVRIEFFDPYLQVTGTITSNYAINNETDQITIFRKNVVVVNDQMTFTTEELTWDEKKRMYFSPNGTVAFKDGTVFTGAQFSAPQDFSTYKIVKGAGEAYVKGDINP